VIVLVVSMGALVALVLSALVLGLRDAARLAGLPAGRVTGSLVCGLAAWLGVTGGLAAAGVLAPAEGRPPALFVFVLLAIGGTIGFSRGATGRRLLEALPPARVIALQVFRVPVELLLWLLAARGLVPERMSFTGRNFDVLVGLSAPFVAWGVARGRIGPRGQRLWHLAALGLVLNVAITAVLSAPGPQRLFFDQVPLLIVAQPPWVWLPTVLVPIAICSHVLSLLRLASARPPGMGEA